MTFVAIPKRATDLRGRVFARLTVVGPVDYIRNEVKWLCQCECGGTTITTISSLRSGHTKSCGCWREESRLIQSIKHGKCRSKIYGVWRAMLDRCYAENNENYPNYGGRGITVCDAWRNDFREFHEHVKTLSGYGKKGMSLDRVDTDGDYFPGNVRWATNKQQSRNKRNNRLLTYNGKTQCMQAWCEEVGINEPTLHYRLKRGWSIEKSLTTPIQFQAGKNQRVSAARWLKGLQQ